MKVARTDELHEERATASRFVRGMSKTIGTAILVLGLAILAYGGRAFSLFGALNGNILVGPRVLYAVAHDVPLLAPLRRVSAKTKTPAVSIVLVCLWSMALIVLPDLRQDKSVLLADWLTNYCIFGGSIFYLSAVLAVFVFRRARPDAHRPYRAWGYPVTPAIFVLFYALFLASMIYSRPQESLVGLLLIGVGLLVYLAMDKTIRRDAAPSE